MIVGYRDKRAADFAVGKCVKASSGVRQPTRPRWPGDDAFVQADCRPSCPHGHSSLSRASRRHARRTLLIVLEELSRVSERPTIISSERKRRNVASRRLIIFGEGQQQDAAFVLERANLFGLGQDHGYLIG